MRIFFIILFLICFSTYSTLYAQCETCPILPVEVDLTASPDMVWVSDVLPRDPIQCCSPPSSTARCVRFTVWTHPDAQLLNFEINSGASPPGHSYSLNCGAWTPMGTPICISGVGPHCVLVCKPGGNENSFRITSSKAADISPPITIGEGCQDTIWVSGLKPSTIQWRVVNPGTMYNSYLSATAGVEEVYVASPPLSMGIPFFDVEVTGEIEGFCSGIFFKDTVRINFVSDKTLEILPANPVICYGGTPATLTASPGGGLPPYKYLWSTGATTQSIVVSQQGDYSVQVWDATDCPVIEAFTYLKTFASPITVDAGDGNICASTNQVQLQGIVNEAQGGVWSGGGGLYNPSNTDLQAIYTLSAAEMLAQSVTLTLTSTGNWGCPPASDNITITISPMPFVDAGDDGMVCASTTAIPIEGKVWGDATQGVWSTLGTGSFTNPNQLQTIYQASPTDIALGYVYLVLSSVANGICEPVTDTVRIAFGNEPIPNFTFPQPACSGQPIQFTDISTVSWGIINKWEWDFGNGMTSVVKNPTVTYAAFGVYTVTLRVTSDKGCTTEISKQITVSPDPVANFSNSTTCEGQTMNFTDLSTNASAWQWNFSNGTVSSTQHPSGVTYQFAGTYNVTLTVTSAEGCKNTITKPVSVLPTPIAQFSVGTICIHNPITFQNTSSVDGDVIISWNWNFGNGDVSNFQNPTTTYTSAVLTNVSLQVATATCSSTITKPINPRPLPLLTPFPSSGCTPYTVSFTSATEPLVTYIWNFGDGSFASSPNPTHTFYNTGTSTVSYQVKTIAQNEFACRDSVFSTIEVFPRAVASFTPSSNRICTGSTLMLVNNSQNAVSYAWNFGDGNTSTEQHPSHVYHNTTPIIQTYTVSLTVTSVDGCTHTFTRNILVDPLPDLVISTNTDAACHPALITFQTQSGAQSYVWDFGDGTIVQGANVINHTFVNAGLTDVVYTVTLTATSVQGCVNSFTRDILVYASPIADFALTPDRGCAPLQVAVQNNSYNTSVCTWTYGDGTVETTCLPSLQHVYQNTSATAAEFTMLLSVQSPSGCVDSKSQKVYVYPEVHVDFSAIPTSGCSPLTVQFSNQSSQTNSYQWNFGNGFSSSLANPTHTFVNNTYNPIDYIVTLIGSSSYACVDSAKHIITLRPLVKADFTLSSNAICTNQSVSFTNQSIHAASVLWDFGDGATSTLLNPSHVFVNTGTQTVVYPVKLKVISADNCTDSIIRYVSVYPLPNSTITLDKNAACQPALITFYTENGYKTYQWNFGDGFQTTGSNVMPHTYYNATPTVQVFDVSLQVTSHQGCVSTVSDQVTVYPSPQAFFTAPSVCYGQGMNFTDNSILAHSWHWVFNNGSTSNVQHPQNVLYAYAGLFDVSLTVQSIHGCESTVTNQVRIHQKPVAQFSVGTICEKNPVTFQDNSMVQNDIITSWNWNLGNGTNSTNKNPTTTYTLVTPVTVSLSVSTAYCSDVISKIVEPRALPKLTAINSAGCAPHLVNFMFPAEANVSYSWSFGDGSFSSAANPSHVYSNATSNQLQFPVKVVAVNNFACKDSVSSQVIVYPNTVADFIVSSASICSNEQVSFTNTSMQALAYEWDFGDGVVSTEQHPSHVFVNTGLQTKYFPVRLIVTSAHLCKDTIIKYISVYPVPSNNLTFSTQAACHPAVITMQTAVGAQLYYWDFGDGFSVQGSHTITHTFNNTGMTDVSYPVSLTITSMDGCVQTLTGSVLVYASPIANFTVLPDRGCAPLVIDISNTSYNVQSFSWKFGDGDVSTSSSAQLQHIYANTTSLQKEFLLELSVESASGCKHQISKPIYVYPEIFVDFSAQPLNGCSPFPVSFTNLSTNISTYMWYFGNGFTSSQPNVTHVYTNESFVPKAYEVTLVGSSSFGCVDSSKHSVTVNPLVKSNFTMSSSAVCSNTSVSFVSQPINAVTYAWNFGDGNTSAEQHPTHTFVNNGVETVYYPVTLIVYSQDNCSDTITKFITVYPIPDFPIQLSEDASCSPAAITLSTNPGAQLYHWDFGDGTATYASHQILHSFVNMGLQDVTYPITLSITTLQGCKSSSTSQIVVYASPIANFSVSKSGTCAPIQVSLHNASFNVSKYSWDFGDGSVSQSSDATIVHEYENYTVQEKQFVIQLQVESANGCTDKLTRQLSVYPYIDVDVFPTVSEGCSPLLVGFANLSVGVDYHEWDFNNSNVSYDREPSQIFFNNLFQDQIFTVRYIGSSLYGCSDTVYMPITVKPLLKAEFSLSATEVCSGQTIFIQNTTTNGISYQWKFGNGQSSQAVNPQVVFTNNTQNTLYFPITLVAYSVDNCVDSIVKYVSVHPLPKGDITLSSAAACHPAQITLTAASGSKTYLWNYGDGTSEYGSHTINHTFVNTSSVAVEYTVSLTYTSMNGCVGNTSTKLIVNPSPIAHFASSTQIGCSPLSITFTNNSQAGQIYEWSIGNEPLQVIHDMQFSRTFYNTGASQISYPIVLTVTNQAGCKATHQEIINVYPTLLADFKPSKTIGCSPLEINFENKSQGANSYTWVYGDGNSSSNFNTKHMYMNQTAVSQVYHVFLVAKSAYNCIDTSDVVAITIHPKPRADFNAQTISGCAPFEVNIQNTSQGAVSYLWNLGNGVVSTDTDVVGLYYDNELDTIVKYMMHLTATNEYGCLDTSMQPITVFPKVMPKFDKVEAGCTPLEVSFKNTSLNASQFLWDFGNGKKSSIANPTTVFTNETYEDKNFIITLTATSSYGCSGTYTDLVTVYPKPSPNFITSASYLRIPESTIGVTNLTKGNWDYLWTFGDGAKTDETHPAPHTYNSAKEYQIVLKASGEHCWDTISHFITIAGARVYADYDSSMYGCIPLTVTFTNKSRNATWYKWDFGNGDTSTEENPTYTYTEPGVYLVELTAGNDELTDVSRAHTVSVYANPTAVFEIAPEYAYLPNAWISTYNKSHNGYTYMWYFGDGTTSDEFQPTHEYFVQGFYDIALAVTSREGCYDSVMVLEAAKVLLECKLLFPNVFTPIHETTGGYYDPTEPEITNDIFHPVWQNIIEYELQIFNRWGEIVFESTELERGWDGHYKGRLSKSDTYVWRAQATCWGGKKLQFKGNVTLLR